MLSTVWSKVEGTLDLLLFRVKILAAQNSYCYKGNVAVDIVPSEMWTLLHQNSGISFSEGKILMPDGLKYEKCIHCMLKNLTEMHLPAHTHNTEFTSKPGLEELNIENR